MIVGENSDLYNFAADRNIVVEAFDLPTTKSTSLLFPDGSSFIGVDPFQMETTADERVHLAHEIGHCQTGAFYSTSSPLFLRTQDEYRANVWAIKHLIPCKDFLTALSDGLRTVWELADYFNVTESFMRKAIEYYKPQIIC